MIATIAMLSRRGSWASLKFSDHSGLDSHDPEFSRSVYALEDGMAKTSEPELGSAVMRALAMRPNYQATVRTQIKHVPDYGTLTAEDHELSGGEFIDPSRPLAR